MASSRAEPSARPPTHVFNFGGTSVATAERTRWGLDLLHEAQLDDGELIAEVIPERWMLSHYRSQIEAPVAERSNEQEQVAVLSKVE